MYTDNDLRVNGHLQLDDKEEEIILTETSGNIMNSTRKIKDLFTNSDFSSKIVKKKIFFLIFNLKFFFNINFFNLKKKIKNKDKKNNI